MSVYLITGSSRGLGRAITEAALAAGHQVVATARRPEQLDDFGAAHGDRVAPVALDVTEYDAATHAVQTAVERFGRLDLVVNNAGYADLASVEDMSIDAFRAQIDTNLLGVVNVTKASLPVLRAQGSGHIIQISSVGGRIANAGLSAYQAAKFAVGGFSEALAQEVGPLGIKIAVLEPGGMRTEWAGSSMTIPPISEPYAATVGALAAILPRGAAAAASDPAKVAQVVLEIAAMDERRCGCCSAPTPSATPPRPRRRVAALTPHGACGVRRQITTTSAPRRSTHSGGNDDVRCRSSRS